MISLENARHCLNQLDANQLKPILTLLIVIACALYLPVLTVCFFFLTSDDYFSFGFLTQSKTTLNKPLYLG